MWSTRRCQAVRGLRGSPDGGFCDAHRAVDLVSPEGLINPAIPRGRNHRRPAREFGRAGLEAAVGLEHDDPNRLRRFESGRPIASRPVPPKSPEMSRS
jgi:hypothetical protein